MKYLVSCTCGHPMDQHAQDGCAGASPGDLCPCGKDERGALDAAIDHARRNPWDGYERPSTALAGREQGDAA